MPETDPLLGELMGALNDLQEPTPGPQGQPAANPAPAAAVDQAANWRPTVKPVVRLTTVFVFPQWHIQPEEQHEFTEALSECLEQIAPGGLAGKYACWVRLTLCTGMICVVRAAQNGGKLPPLGQPKPKSAAAESTEPPKETKNDAATGQVENLPNLATLVPA